MITAQDAEKLRSMRAPGNSVLSLYLPVPVDPAELRGLPALAADMIDSAVAAADHEPRGQASVTSLVSADDRDAVRTLLETQARKWLGHTLAVFVSGGLGLLEMLPLPGQIAARGVLSTRPHIRPLLAVLQRFPDYLVAIVGRQHAWLFSVTEGQVQTIARPEATAVRSHGYGGWHGLQAYRVHQRETQLTQSHYRHVVRILAGQAPAGGRARPLVIGGHAEGIAQLLRTLPPAARETVAGSFHADPLALTPARARALADRVIEGWAARSEQEAMAAALDAAPGTKAAIGLQACLAAVNAGAADLLLIGDDELAPGFVCARCGRLNSAVDGCPDGETAAGAVADLLEEMALRVLDSGGQVITVRDAPVSCAARLRYPPAEAASRR
jgi:Bacterial archaeo-eukaryotic release factor family 10